VLNRSDKAHSARIPLGRTETQPYEAIFTTASEGYRVQQDAEALLLEVPARSGLLLERQ